MTSDVRASQLKIKTSSARANTEVDEKLISLSRTVRNQLFGYPWVIGVIVLLLSIYAPTDAVRFETSAMGLILLLTPFAYLAGVSLKWLVHWSVGICTTGIVLVALQTGGIYSAQIVWLLLIPMMPLRLISVRASLAWLTVSILILVLFGSMDHPMLVFDSAASATNLSSWSFLQHVFLCICMLAMPWYYAKTYKQSIAVMRRYNKIIHHKKIELIHEQANKKLFISRLSHEMRTPMNAVVGFSHLLEAQADLYPQAAGVVAQIQITSKHLLTIINGIMDYTQLIDGQLKIRIEDVELKPLVKQTFSMFLERVRGMQIEYTCECPDGLPQWITTDAQRLTQILMNLLELSLQRTSDGFVQLRTQTMGASLVFTVHDSGAPLIDEELRLLNLKQMSSQDMPLRHVSGSALGLTMAKALAQLMGGDLEAANHAGQGASLRLRLPLVMARVSQPEQRAISEKRQVQQPIQTLRIDILVVDDNPVNRLLVQQVIHAQWPLAKVSQAENGQQALSRLSDQKFDLILMDMLMPEMDGIEATQMLRQDSLSPNQWIPVLGLTANISTEDHVRCLSAGMNDVLLKPFDRQVLADRIEGLLLACPLFTTKHAFVFHAKE